MSSKADDFDVRYRDAGPAGPGRPPADGGYRGNAGEIDYDLGYDAPGWDTQGFRRPDTDHLDSHGPRDGHDGTGRGPGLTRGGVGTAVRPEPRLGGARGGRPPRSQQRPRGLRGLTGPGRRGADRTRVNFKGSWWRHWTLRKAVGVLLAVVGGMLVLGAVAVVIAYEQTPVPTAAMAATGYSQSVVYSKDGSLVGRFGTTNRKMLTRNQIPPTIINAVLAAEDRNFYNEGGISPTGIVRAAYSDVRGGDGSLQGGSTITQEFVRQYYSGIGTQQTLTRKIKEIFVAMKVAKEKSKDWILTNYLNTIYLGQGAYGVEAAAQTYYGRHVSQLSTAQAAVIAAIIQQPSNYPLPQYRAQLENRWHYVLNGMVQMGTLTAQRAAAMKFPVPGSYVPQSVGRDVWDPYVLNMVYNELTDIYHLSKSQIYNGGYVIRTSVDDTKMAALYQAVRDNLAQINASGFPFHPTYMHVGAVLEDPATGAIQALYPGPGYPGQKYNGTGKRITAGYCEKILCEDNMAVYSREQVGSSFKPYILAAAVKQGMNVQTSTLNGYNNLCIPPDSLPSTYPVPAIQTGTKLACQTSGYYPVPNDSAAENGPYTPQLAMALSINTAYTDLWHTVAGNGGMNVVNLVQEFGVNTDRAGITAASDHEEPGGPRARPGVADRGGTGHHAGHAGQRRRLPQRARDHVDHPEQRPADAHQDHQLPGVQLRPDAEHQHGLPGAVRDVQGRHVLRHRAGVRDEQRPGDHRQDRDHELGPVGVLHRRHPEPGPGRRDPHQPAGQGLADPAQPRRQQPGRFRRHLAGHDLAHLRRGHVRPAGRAAVPHPGLHRRHLEPGAARAAPGAQEAQEARSQRERRPERPGRRPGRVPQAVAHLQL